MKLNAIQKQNLLESASKVYNGYVALDFCKNKEFEINGVSLTLEEICKQAIKTKTLKQEIALSGQVFTLELTEAPTDFYNVALKRPVSISDAQVEPKPINDYDSQEVLNLLSKQKFCFHEDADKNIHVANRLNAEIVIGGAGKIDLYRTHLITLHNIIQKISTEEDISSLLVAMATGSGKTFVQALWMLVLYMSGNDAIFAVPDNLVNQFCIDLQAVLPNNLTQKILVLLGRDNKPEIDATINSFKSESRGQPNIIVGSSERLLDDYYQQLLDLEPGRVFLSFDEQHLVMKTERRRVRLLEISKKMLSMFLTATPNEETYLMSGSAPVAIMSSAQKQEAGQGQFPEIFTETARNISDRNKSRNYRFWTAEFWKNIYYRVLIGLANTIEKEQSSAATSIVESLPFYLYRKPDEEQARWRMQVPMARKMLCIIDDNETLVNFCYALENNSTNVYRNGNIVDREDVSDFFMVENVDRAIVAKDLSRRRSEHAESLRHDEFDIGKKLAATPLKEQLGYNIFHNMMEYVLTDLTGLSEIEHNHMRKSDPKAFQELIYSKFVARDSRYYQSKLAEKIDTEGAETISQILALISGVLADMHIHRDINPSKFNNFIDNWALNNSFVDQILRENPNLRYLFNDYAEQHLIISIMTGMQTAETPVTDSTPFLGLQEKRYPIYEDGLLSPDAKRRQHSSLEILNDFSQESKFTPRYTRFDERTCDNYFRLGFVGIYASNKKTQGFSDRNLHTVINLAEEKLSTTNSPETLIQGIGRNRGLDDTVVPAYIHALGREQTSVFNLEHLQEGDYYPELFKSQKSYNKQLIKVLGKTVGDKIIRWYKENVDKDETIDHDALKSQVRRIIAQSLRELNNNNAHNIALSRSQLSKVIGEAMRTLDNEIKSLKQPYKISLSVKILGVILNFISETYYTFKRLRPAILRFRHSWFGKRSNVPTDSESTKHPDDVYIKVINSSSFKKILKNIGIANEFKNWIARKALGLETIIKKHTEDFLQDEFKEELTTHKLNSIGPLLSKFVVLEQQEKVLQAVAAMPYLIGLLEKNKAKLKAIIDGDSEIDTKQEVLLILQQIPGLENLRPEDIIDYQQQIADYLSIFEQGYLVLLNQNAELTESAIQKLVPYFQGKFITDAASFCIAKDLGVLRTTLQQADNTERFLKHLLQKSKDDASFATKDPKAIFQEFQSFFGVYDFARLDSRVEECFTSLGEEISLLQQNPLANLNDEKLTEISQVIYSEILVCLVNVYPLDQREGIMEAITLEKVKEFVKSNGQSLITMAADPNKEELASFVFSNLIPDLSVAPLDINQEVIRVKSVLDQRCQDILQTPVSTLVKVKLANPRTWRMRNSSHQALFDIPIRDLIKSDDFAAAISLMLSFDEWQDLKTKIATDEEARTLNLARMLIARGTNLQAEDFIGLINDSYNTKYIGVNSKSERAMKLLSLQRQSISADPITSLSLEAIARIADTARAKLLPILALFIQNSDARASFLDSNPVSDQDLALFLYTNKDMFSALQNPDTEQVKLGVLELINQLLPSDQQLPISAIAHPLIDAAKVAKDIAAIVISSYLTSEHFSSFLQNVFNPQDYRKILLFLKSPEKVEIFVRQITEIEKQELNKERLIELLREEESLSDIKTLDERMQEFEDFVKESADNRFKCLNTSKISELALAELSPIFCHPEFYKSLNALLGFLDEEDLTVMAEAMDKPEPRKQAQLVIEFMQAIKTKNLQLIKEKFLTFTEDEKLDFDNLEFKKTMQVLADIIEEVINCHCEYNKHDKKGSAWTPATSKLKSKISAELQNIHIDSEVTTFKFFASRIFFFEAIKESVPKCAAISADANKSQIKDLNRVKNHMLRPLWWKLNASYLVSTFVTFADKVSQVMQATWFLVINSFKKLINLFTTQPYPTSSRNPNSADYERIATDMATTINHLQRFDPARVKEKCPIDAVADFETSVDARRAPQFFPQPRTPISTASSNPNAGTLSC